jgi:tetratricopeptide (TPR) repeat protein
MGDVMARDGKYEEAKAHYRRALDTMAPPRFVDGLESIAQICELQADFAGAIAALEEELEVFEKEWNFSTGETADKVRREISRLRKL